MWGGDEAAFQEFLVDGRLVFPTIKRAVNNLAIGKGLFEGRCLYDAPLAVLIRKMGFLQLGEKGWHQQVKRFYPDLPFSRWGAA